MREGDAPKEVEHATKVSDIFRQIMETTTRDSVAAALLTLATVISEKE